MEVQRVGDTEPSLSITRSLSLPRGCGDVGGVEEVEGWEQEASVQHLPTGRRQARVVSSGPIALTPAATLTLPEPDYCQDLVIGNRLPA